MPNPKNQSPLELYQTRLQSGAITQDPEQAVAVEKLNILHENILHNRSGGNGSGMWGALSKLTRGKKDKQGLYLHGGVGRGKSMLMDLFFECLPQGLPSRRVHFHAFMIEVHDFMHEQRQKTKNKGPDYLLPALAKNVAGQVKVLCFDEFHVTDIADASILGRLFTALFDQGVIVVATSNWEPDRLYENGLQREVFLPFIDLLKERLAVFHLDHGIDYRANLLREEGSYFYPIGKGSDEKIDMIFEALTQGAALQPLTLTIKGREIKAERTASGAARFTFAELCERPHGAEDFLALAERFRVIFLENVPKLGYDRSNETKRLMTLVDILYENHVKLIMSAETAPDKLYFGDDLKFEFDRTISRLLEMGSKEYLTK